MDFEYQEEYIKNQRGVQLFTCRWLPRFPPKALVFLCHGYGMECSEFMRGCGVRLASAGFGVFGIDYEGHGKSQGARCYIKKFSNIVNDCDHFFKSVCEEEQYRDKARFLYGESMGGAVALLLHRKDPFFWNGAVLVAPMCKISEEVKPHPVVVNILTTIEELIPKWKIVPSKDVIDSAFRDPVKREERDVFDCNLSVYRLSKAWRGQSWLQVLLYILIKIRSNKLIYQDKPRLKTALEMLRTSMNLEERLNEVTLPFLVLHGEADTVTDPAVSRALYESASSMDKTLRLYPGMWHGLTSGEPDHNIDIVFEDIITWLDTHSISCQVPGTPTRLTAGKATTVLAGQGELGGSYGRRCGQPHQNASFLSGLRGRSVYQRRQSAM